MEVWSAQSTPPNREPKTPPQAAVPSFTACQDGNIHVHFKSGQGQSKPSCTGSQCLNESASSWLKCTRAIMRVCLAGHPYVNKQDEDGWSTVLWQCAIKNPLDIWNQTSLHFTNHCLEHMATFKVIGTLLCEHKWGDGDNLWCALVWLHTPLGVPWHPECLATGTRSLQWSQLPSTPQGALWNKCFWPPGFCRNGRQTLVYLLYLN